MYVEGMLCTLDPKAVQISEPELTQLLSACWLAARVSAAVVMCMNMCRRGEKCLCNCSSYLRTCSNTT